MKNNTKLVVVSILLLFICGCETMNKVDQAIGRNQTRIQEFFAHMFLRESESINFAVRIRHEFFVYFPPIDEKQTGLQELSARVMANLSQTQIDTLLNKKLETQIRKNGFKGLEYLETRHYRIFIEPRFISFEYCEGTPPVSAELTNGKYALSLQCQIIIRDKRNGQEICRDTVTVKNIESPRILADFGNTENFLQDLEQLTLATAEEIYYTLKNGLTIKTAMTSLPEYGIVLN